MIQSPIKIDPSLIQSPKPADQIAELERQTMLPRITREFILASVELEASKEGITPEQLYTSNVGYQRLKDLDAQIRVLRAML